jgi:hypothetical protein
MRAYITANSAPIRASSTRNSSGSMTSTRAPNAVNLANNARLSGIVISTPTPAVVQGVVLDGLTPLDDTRRYGKRSAARYLVEISQREAQVFPFFVEDHADAVANGHRVFRCPWVGAEFG